MDYLKKFNLISLGANCMPKTYTKSYINQPTHLFDWIGTPMWGINKLINNNFDLFNPDDYGPMKIYDNTPEIMYCNKKYYFKFLHDLHSDTIINKTIALKDKYGGITKVNYFNNFKEKYKRRLDKFIELLNSDKFIVFIRLQEKTKNKLTYEEYTELYAKPELEYIQEFIHLIKNKYPKLNFKLIYFSESNQSELSDDLLILNTCGNINEMNVKKILDNVIDNNIDLIKNFLPSKK
jgi:hypothetical protein